MTLQEKIDRYVREVSAQQPGRKSIIPPISRVLWGLQIDVPPPLLWSRRGWTILHSLGFTTLLMVSHLLTANHPLGENIVFYLIGDVFGGIVFGFLVSIVARLRKSSSQRLNLSAWYGSPAGDA